MMVLTAGREASRQPSPHRPSPFAAAAVVVVAAARRRATTNSGERLATSGGRRRRRRQRQPPSTAFLWFGDDRASLKNLLDAWARFFNRGPSLSQIIVVMIGAVSVRRGYQSVR